MESSRYEFMVLTLTIFIVGAVLYGGAGIGRVFLLQHLVRCAFYCKTAVPEVAERENAPGNLLLCGFVACNGRCFYSIPYGIYNFVQYRRTL